MAGDAAKPIADIQVIPATLEQMPVLANLLELYSYDFSDFHDLSLGEDGRFGYASLPRYWSEPNRHPFLARRDGKLAGFALVKLGSEVSGNDLAWDMAEFFVLRGYRRRGIGTEIAHRLWSRFTGPWEVRVMPSNVSAGDFWARAISTYTGEAIHPLRVDQGSRCWKLFSFESQRVSE